MQTEFARLTRDNSAVDHEVRAFLTRTYSLKAIADDETGPDAKVTHRQAAEAIEAAKVFISTVAALIAGHSVDHRKPTG